MKEKECCPKFDPKLWDKKSFNWKNKRFIKKSMPTLFHMPFPPLIGRNMMTMWKLVEKSKAQPPMKEWLVLFHDPSPFKSEMLMGCTKKVSDANNVTISGRFEAKVFDGPYKEIRRFFKEFDDYLAKKNKKAKDYYIHYAYCPKCAKKFGHNYMIFFAQI